MKPLFDSKGSLLESQSIVKNKLEDLKKERAALAKSHAELRTKVEAFKMVEHLMG